MKPASKELIAELNNDLVWIVGGGGTFDDAVDYVKDIWKLRLVIESGNTQLYNLMENFEIVYVNLWTYAEGKMDDAIVEGGLGFDDQLHIWEDEE